MLARPDLMPSLNRRKFTLELLRQAPALAKRYRLWDTAVPGLFLSVSAKGIKSFNVQWSRTGSKSIGKFPGMTLDQARKQALDILNDASDNGVPAVASPRAKTFNVFVDEHYAPWVKAERKAGAATVANLKAQFGELFGNKPMTEITAWSVEKFKATRLKGDESKEIEPVSPVTVNRDLDRLRAALNKAVEWKLLRSNPIASVKRAKVADEARVRFLDADEERRLRDALSARERQRRTRRKSGNAHALARGRDPLREWADDEYTDHVVPLVLLAMNTGMRRGELLGLEWAAIDRKRNQIRVAAATSKAGRARHIPLNTEAQNVVEWLHKHSPTKSGLVFAGRAGSGLTHLKRSWSGVVAAAQLSDFHFHDLRHHFASRLVMAGADLYVVKELLGHVDFAMTQRYAHLSDEHKAAVVAKLGAIVR
jgi:integrase